MALVNFDDALWGSVEGIELCDSGGPGNTLSDPSAGISFIIAEGSMEVMDSGGGNRILFFSRINCADTVLPTTTLVLRFDAPQEYVRFRIYPDPVGGAIMMVNFYENTGATDLIESRSLSIGYLTPEEVVYSAATGVREITIRTEAAENRFYEIEFFQTMPEIRNDIALALDGSGSMQNGGKWAAMIEAADIFHDLYKAFGHADDNLGAVRFRWDCMDAVSGNLTVSQPALGSVQSVGDLPDLYASDAPDGCTPVGEGVVQAAGMATGGTNPAKHLLLLTDGKNNRGRSVVSASAAPELTGVTVHTMGLGTGINIDPVEISALAADHGGTFRQTTAASEVLDFFAQVLGDMLGNVEMASVSGNMTTIAPGTEKAVFLIAWEDVTADHHFNLTTPGGVSVDHAAIPSVPGLSITYYPSSANNAHAFFVVEGEIAGTWEFVGVSADAQCLALEDLDLTVQWSVSPTLGLSGEAITVEARIMYQGAPYEGNVVIQADVTRPDESQGDLIARELRLNPITPQSVDDVSDRSQMIATVLKRLERSDFLYETTQAIPFKNMGGGVYRLEYNATELDGIYRFDLKANGDDGEGNPLFARRTSRFCTLVNAIDASASQVQAVGLEKNLYRVTATPVSRSGRYVGPFLADYIAVTSSQGSRIGRLRDNLDGSYSQLIQCDTQEPTEFSIEAFGRQTSISNGSVTLVDRLPWLIVLILLFVLLVVFLT